VVKTRIRVRAFRVKVYDVFQSEHAAVMHVRSGQSDIAQARHLEPAPVLLMICYFEATEIRRLFAPTDSGVMEFLVGKQRSAVASDAVAFASEDLQAALAGV
jgi:hypothetical protein